MCCGQCGVMQRDALLVLGVDALLVLGLHALLDVGLGSDTTAIRRRVMCVCVACGVCGECYPTPTRLWHRRL